MYFYFCNIQDVTLPVDLLMRISGPEPRIAVQRKNPLHISTGGIGGAPNKTRHSSPISLTFATE